MITPLHKSISLFVPCLLLSLSAAHALGVSIETLPHATIYSVVLKRPPQILAFERLQTVEAVPRTTHAQLVVNAGFFDPVNQLTSSFALLKDGQWISPENNPRLVNNPALARYLPQIFNRSELRLYDCGKRPPSLAITRHQDAAPLNVVDCKLSQAVGGGPQLLPQLTDKEEGFTDQNGQGQLIRDSIGVLQRNARTAIGLLPDNRLLLVMVAQQPEHPLGSGMSLPELADYFRQKGVSQAMAFDGGSSSGMVVNGKTYWGKVNAKGQWVKRPVKTVLVIMSNHLNY